MLPTTVSRVPLQTAEHVNERIQSRIHEHVARTAALGPQAIEDRLKSLDAEWDIERTLETNASFIAFTGVCLGALVNPWFLLLPAAVTGFLFQHALQGWCPPLPIFRRLGYRTQSEIEQERYALKAVRGDFQTVDHAQDHPERVRRAVEAVTPSGR